MHRGIATLVFPVFATLIPLAAIAQDAPAPYTGVTAFDVPVNEVMRFEEAARQIVDAAGKAKLKRQFGWGIWQNANTYAVVGEMQKIGELDDPMMWMRQFENTPGQSVLMQAFGKFTGMHYREENEVLQFMPAWSYMPAGMTQPPSYAWAEVAEYWMVAGSDEQYEQLVKEALAVLRSINYPFMIAGYRTPVGKRRNQFVVLYDDPGRYAAAQASLEKNPQWQALGVRFMGIVSDMQMTVWRFRPELSFMGQ
ncbi:MAG: hypothetical protein ACT4O1_17080 [Gemmatimonadota bacterium]